MDKNLNLNLYRIFYEVTKYSSISAAAKSMYLSQPAISKSIKNLETELGITLFDRALNGIVLTENGKELFTYVEEAFNSIRLAEKKMLENKNLEKGTLAIGIRSHIASFYLVDKVIEFHNKYPKIEITIINRPSNELLKLLNNNRKILNQFAKDNNIRFQNVLSVETSELIYDFVKRGEGVGYILKDMVIKDVESGLLKIIDIKEDLPKASLKLICLEKRLTEASHQFISDYLK